jgi:hypothetical protein
MKIEIVYAFVWDTLNVRDIWKAVSTDTSFLEVLDEYRLADCNPLFAVDCSVHEHALTLDRGISNNNGIGCI